MDEKQAKRQIRLWWIGCAAAVVALQAIVSAMLFIPQNRLIASLSRQDAETEAVAQGRVKSADMLRETNTSISLVAAELAALNLPGSQPPPDAILDAVARANEDGCVKLIGLSRTVEAGQKAAVEQSPFWSVKVRGAFPDVVRFLNRVEKEGVLLGSDDFKMTADEKGGGVVAEVAVSSHTEASLQGRLQNIKAGKQAEAQ